MSEGHVVVPTGECSFVEWGGEACLGRAPGRCGGCLSGGRRALLDQAVPVEEWTEYRGAAVVGRKVWRGVES